MSQSCKAASWFWGSLKVKLPNQFEGCLIRYELGHTSCEVASQFFSISMNFVLFVFAAILMVPHCSPDGSRGMPLVPPRFSMSGKNKYVPSRKT